MAADYIRGNDFNLYLPVNGYNYLVCHATDCRLNTTRETIETTTKNGVNGKTFNFGGKPTTEITLSGVTNNVDTASPFYIMQALLSATKLPFRFTDSQNITWSGVVLAPSIDFDSPVNGISQFNSGLLVDGELTMVTEGVTPPPEGSSVNIIDQLGETLATVPAPGNYTVFRFDTLDLSGWEDPQIIITLSDGTFS